MANKVMVVVIIISITSIIIIIIIIIAISGEISTRFVVSQGVKVSEQQKIRRLQKAGRSMGGSSYDPDPT